MTAQMDNYLQFPVEEDYDDGDEGDNSPSDDEEEEQEQGTANNNEQGTAGIMDRKRKLKLDDLPQTDDINVNVSGPIRSDDPVENADRVAAMQYAADFEARQPPSKLARMNNTNSNNLVASTLGSAQTVIPSAQSQQQQALAQANTSIPFQPQTQRLNNNNPVARSSQIIQPAPEPEMKITKSTRWKPSKSQRDVLLQEFEVNPYPTVPHKGDIADRLGVKRAQVAKWFQHRRETLVRLGQFKGEKQRDRRTKEELDILERTFNVNPYPNGPECVELCQQLPGVTEAQIRLWFKHKRNALLKRAHQRGSSSKGTVRPANANASEAAANHQVDQAHGSSSRAAVAGGSSMTLSKNVPNSQVPALHKNIASGVSTLTASPMPASPRANKHEHSPPLGMMPMQQQQQQQQQQQPSQSQALQAPNPQAASLHHYNNFFMNKANTNTNSNAVTDNNSNNRLNTDDRNANNQSANPNFNGNQTPEGQPTGTKRNRLEFAPVSRITPNGNTEGSGAATTANRKAPLAPNAKNSNASAATAGQPNSKMRKLSSSSSLGRAAASSKSNNSLLNANTTNTPNMTNNNSSSAALKANGKNASPLESQSPHSGNTNSESTQVGKSTSDAEAKRNLRAVRNREAAMRCRQKEKARLARMQNEINDMSTELARIQAMSNKLRASLERGVQ